VGQWTHVIVDNSGRVNICAYIKGGINAVPFLINCDPRVKAVEIKANRRRLRKACNNVPYRSRAPRHQRNEQIAASDAINQRKYIERAFIPLIPDIYLDDFT
jgi:hypothetical protein